MDRKVILEFEFVGDDDHGSLVISSGSAKSLAQTALMQNNLEEACRVVEDNGPALADELVAAVQDASPTTREKTAQMFEKARDFGRAAKVYEVMRRWSDAANMHEKANDFAAAAKCHESAGDDLKAGKAWDRAGSVDQALRAFQKAGAREALADCLARHGRPWDAARLYQQLGNVRGEVESLRLVPVHDPARLAAAMRLGGLLAQYNKIPEAIRVVVETLRGNAQAANDRGLLDLLARLFEKSNQKAEAEKVRARIAKLPGAQAAAAAAPVLTPVPPTPEIAVEEVAEVEGGDGYEFLKAIPMFAELQMPHMKDLYRISRPIRFPAGHVVFEAGVEGPGLLIILDGTVDVFLKGSDKPVNTLGKGKWVGEISLIRNVPTTAKVVARTEVKALLIRREQFDHFLYGNETAAVRVYRLFAQNLADRVAALSATH